MAEFTANYHLKKPAPEDFYNIADFNENADLIDAALAQKADKDDVLDIDCGVWDVGPVAAHNASAAAHQNLRIDGNAAAPSETGDTLVEHETDPGAHQNMIVDGNAY